MNRQRIAVIGGVASGTAAAAEAHRVDPEAEIVLFEAGPYISYGACEIPLFLGGYVDRPERLIAFTPERFSRERGADVRTSCFVDNIEPRRGLLHFRRADRDGLHEERFDKFILATGARARLPYGASDEAPNVFVVRELTDAAALDAYRSENEIHHAVVAGGGYVGLEVAEALHLRGIRVSLLQPPPGPLHRQIGPELSQRVAGLLEASGITVRPDRFDALRIGSDGRARAVVTASGELIGCQLVVLALGTEPETTLGAVAGVKIGTTGGYRVDAGMRTNVANVWACGDCVEVRRVMDDEPVLSPLSLTAFRTGRVAGRNAVRRGGAPPARFEGVVPAQGVALFEKEIAYVGLTVSDARTAGFSAAAVQIRHRTRAALVPGSAPIDVSLVFETARGRLLGAQLFGGAGTVYRADVLIPMIRAGMTVADLYESDLIYAPAFSPRLDPLLIAAKKAVDFLTFPRGNR